MSKETKKDSIDFNEALRRIAQTPKGEVVTKSPKKPVVNKGLSDYNSNEPEAADETGKPPGGSN